MALPLEELERRARELVEAIDAQSLIQTVVEHGEVTVVLTRTHIVEVIRRLRETPELKFEHLSDVNAVDYLDVGREPRFDVVYHLYSFDHHHWLRLRCPVGEEDCAIDTITGLWSGAAFMERETYDMFGIRFNGHEGLARILMPDNWEGHPLRKDFPLGGSKSFYYKQDSNEYAGEPDDLVPRMRVQKTDI